MAAVVRELVAAGLSGEALACAIERIEEGSTPIPVKERVRAFREREKASDVTHVTRNVTALQEPSPKESSPTPPKETTPSRSEEPSGSSATADAVTLDPRETLFGHGRKVLQALSGLPEQRARGVLGRWLQRTGDDPGAILALLEEARRGRKADVVSWVESILKPRSSTGPPGRAAPRNGWTKMLDTTDEPPDDTRQFEAARH